MSSARTFSLACHACVSVYDPVSGHTEGGEANCALCCRNQPHDVTFLISAADVHTAGSAQACIIPTVPRQAESQVQTPFRDVSRASEQNFIAFFRYRIPPTTQTRRIPSSETGAGSAGGSERSSSQLATFGSVIGKCRFTPSATSADETTTALAPAISVAERCRKARGEIASPCTASPSATQASHPTMPGSPQQRLLNPTRSIRGHNY